MVENSSFIKTLNAQGDIIELVSINDWLSDIDNNHSLNRGVIVSPEENIELLKDSLNKISLIALDFDTFDDGRGYSQATLMRIRWGYKGEIKGINAHLDQLQFMIRSGIDTYDLKEQYKGADEKSYSNSFSICYQLAPNNVGMKKKF